MTKKTSLIVLFLVIFIVVAVEIFNLTTISLWHDESFSALLIKYDFGEMIARIKMDVHPPLYYILLREWSAFLGNSLFSIRLFSVFFSVLAIISLYFLVKELFENETLAVFSSVLFALSYFQIQYAMEARMYSLGTFLIIISSYFFSKALKTKKWNWWLLYAASISLAVYTHYFTILWILAQGIFFLYIVFKEEGLNIGKWFKNKNFQLGMAAYILAALSFTPWLGTFIKQSAQVQQSYWIPPISIWSIPNTFAKMTGGDVVDSANASYILIILVLIILFAVFLFSKKEQRKEKYFVLLSLFIPFLLTVILSVKRPLYVDRYFIFGFPFYLILLGETILLINNTKLKKLLMVLVLLGISITFPFRWYRVDAKNKPGMAAAAAYLNNQYKPGDKIFSGSSFVYFTFKYYNKTATNPLLFAPGYIPHYSGTALLSPSDIITDFNSEVRISDIVWMINTTGFGNYQPTVPDNWKKIDEKGFQDVYALGWIIISKYQVQ